MNTPISAMPKHRISLTKSLLIGTCLTLAVSGFSAFAETASDSDAETPAASDKRLGVVTVTAQKREENAQDVPISLTALGEQELEAADISGTEDLRSAVPALNFTTATGSFGLPRIRGVGSTGQGPGIENPVAVYVDGVYYSSSFGILQNAYDAEQVTVLKGPQGTLFGRNATGGLIQITTLGPTDEVRFKGEVGLENYDTVSGNAFVSGPITNAVSGSLSGQYYHRAEGYGENVFTGGKIGDELNYNLRGKLLFDISDVTSLLLSADYSERSAGAPAFRPIDTNDIGDNIADIIRANGGDADYDIYADLDPQVLQEQWGLSATFEHDFGGMTLKSITAYRDTDSYSQFDPDGRVESRIRIFNRQAAETFTQEFDLISNTDSPLQWVVGLYYMDEEAGQPNSQAQFQFNPFAPPFTNVTDTQVTLESISAFVEFNYALTEATTLTAGGRFTRDERAFTATATDGSGFGPPVINYGPTSETFEEPNWKLSIDHRFNDNFMAYASYNRGFRSGTYEPDLPPGLLEPEIVDAYEVGFKSTILDGRGRFNAAAYFYDQSSVQVFQIISGTQTIRSAENGAEITGIDADFGIDLTDNFSIFGGVNWIDATYNDFPNAYITTPFPLNTEELARLGTQACQGTFAPPTAYPFLPGGNCVFDGDATGNKLQNTPELTASLGGRYNIDTSFGNIVLAGNIYYNDGYFVDADERLKLDSFSTFAASATWRPNDSNYYVRVWGKNLTDAYYLSQYGASNSGDNGYAGAPKTYGIAVGVDF